MNSGMVTLKSVWYTSQVSEINIGSPIRAIIKPRGEVSRSRIIVLIRFSIHNVRKQNINILLAFAMWANTYYINIMCGDIYRSYRTHPAKSIHKHRVLTHTTLEYYLCYINLLVYNIIMFIYYYSIIISYDCYKIYLAIFNYRIE